MFSYFFFHFLFIPIASYLYSLAVGLELLLMAPVGRVISWAESPKMTAMMSASAGLTARVR